MIFSQIIILGMMWWLLTGGTLSSWLIGIPAIFGAVLTIRFLGVVPAFRVRLIGGLRFVIYFGKQSILSGVDVAWRSLQLRPQLNPGFLHYSFRLSGEVSRIFFVNMISLLPGSLSADLREGGVLVHVIDETSSNMENLRKLEDRVADFFGEELMHE